jgi:hypothetical protein
MTIEKTKIQILNKILNHQKNKNRKQILIKIIRTKSETNERK